MKLQGPGGPDHFLLVRKGRHIASKQSSVVSDSASCYHIIPAAYLGFTSGRRIGWSLGPKRGTRKVGRGDSSTCLCCLHSRWLGRQVLRKMTTNTRGQEQMGTG